MSKQNGDKLWTSTFVALNIILLLNFCNMSVFFQFNSYLKNMGMDQSHIGLVIGLFSLAALLVRPLISPFLQPANSKRWIFWGAVCTVACLLAYNLAHDLISLAILRLVHGSFYVLMATAALAAFTGCIPQAKSGQAFGVVGIVALLPFALVPPILPALESLLGGYLAVLTLTAIPVGCVVFLLPLVKIGQAGAGGAYAFNFRDIADNLRQPAILALLGISLFMYAAFSCLFYYVEGFAKGLSIAMAGLFFTIATAAEIASRFGMGPFLDIIDKKKAAIVSLGVLSAAYLILPLVDGAGLFFSLAAVFGFAWGVAIPSLSAMIFDISEPRFRALNTNLGFEMMQGGYFIGPVLGGAVLDDWGYGTLFIGCAGACLVSLGLALAGRAK